MSSCGESLETSSTVTGGTEDRLWAVTSESFAATGVAAAEEAAEVAPGPGLLASPFADVSPGRGSEAFLEGRPLGSWEMRGAASAVTMVPPDGRFGIAGWFIVESRRPCQLRAISIKFESQFI